MLAGILGAFGALALTIADALGGFIAEMTANFPAVLTALVGGNVPGGYVVGELFNLIFPIALVVFAINVGASAVAGEERDGTMAVLAAQPLTRIRLLWTKATGVALSLVVVVSVNWVVMALFIAAGATELTLVGLTGATIHLLFLALAFGALAFGVATATGRPSLGSAVAGGFALAAYLTATMLPLVDLHQWAKGSPWYYYLANSDPLRTGVTLSDLGVFTGVVAAAMTMAVLAFPHRDLRG